MVKNYKVNGMTCDHCAMSVTEEIEEIVGAQVVNIDVPSGMVTVSGEDVSDIDIAAAIKEAGFELDES
ncbi:heavy-metal-associated domain-containing protein [Corynebacterium aquilae]|uniref:Transporter n=1 Tax=Corynebacterium aquilae DSM 44791 TaxID=1431546 RepID=A0A1L7CIR6_9CORY|nr:heavy-metal-associated domain-containing protein [Corynebacterium aquilae]APT85705.1 transporter [Corynebacterium aquilae DSM 44791]